MKRIAEGLERDGILTGAGKTRWYDSTINKILRNETVARSSLASLNAHVWDLLKN